jgi:hypothetical protein
VNIVVSSDDKLGILLPKFQTMRKELVLVRLFTSAVLTLMKHGKSKACKKWFVIPGFCPPLYMKIDKASWPAQEGKCTNIVVVVHIYFTYSLSGA